MERKCIRSNIKKTAGFFLALLVILILYMSYLQIIQGNAFYESPFNQRANVYTESVRRGDIVDRHGERLAYSIQNDSGYERFYPLGCAAAHIVGYMDSKLGSSGVESSMQSYLSGSRNPAHGLGAAAAVFRNSHGATIQLTLDAKLQQAAYQALAGRKGAIVALNPQTGEILAMVSMPAYDPNRIFAEWETLQQDENGIFLNRAVQGLYPPGSILKPLIADIALTENEVTPSSQMECFGYIDIVSYRLPESQAAIHGKMNLKQALTVSCNTYFAATTLALGPAKLQRGFERFGFYKDLTDTGFYEEKCRIPDFDQLTQGELAQSGIGQGSILVTPLRMAMLAATFANHGKLMKPYLISEITAPDGHTLKKYRPEKWQDVTTAEYADIIMLAMENAVANGTGSAAFIKEIAVAGKTGTAENAQDKPHAWFIGAAPADDPSIVVAVIVENSGGGGLYAAPVARHIIEQMVSEEGK